MAGSHKVRVYRPDSSHWFEVSGKPAHPLSCIPVVGPFITYNLGRNPKFSVSVKYLGSDTEEGNDSFDSLQEAERWIFDLYLHIDGEYIQDGDILPIDLRLISDGQEQQEYVTREWPLTRPGRAELQIGAPNPYTAAIYSFEVKDTTVPLFSAIIAFSAAAVGGIVGWILATMVGA
jgi:hypothetical protein